MVLNQLKISVNGKKYALPDWIKFSFYLGYFIYDMSLTKNKKYKIILSLPFDEYVPLFIAMGIVDQIYSRNMEEDTIKRKVLKLKKGNRVIYKDSNSVKRVSVISVKPNPYKKGEMMLVIKDGNVEHGIPEQFWAKRIKLLDTESKKIKRARTIPKDALQGIENNKILNNLYSKEHLRKITFSPKEYFYLIGNLSKIKKQMNENIFSLQREKGSISDFLYFDKNLYRNGLLISSKAKKIEMKNNCEIPVIYCDVSSYLKHSNKFNKNPEIIVISRTDNENRIFEIKEQLKRKIYLENIIFSTNDLIEFLNRKKVVIPNGIELFSWR